MKKLFIVLTSLLLVLSLTSCGKKENEVVVPVEPENNQPTDEKTEGVSTYLEYVALPSDGTAEVTIEAYVQAAQSYYEGTATAYLQDKDGGYFVYNAAISEEDYAKIVTSTDFKEGWYGEGTGAKVRAKGTKSEWSGEVEIIDGTIEVIDTENTYKAEPVIATEAFGTDQLIDCANELVTVNGKIAPSTDADGNEVAYLYKYNGSGAAGNNDDVYFNVDIDGEIFTFTVESYLAYEGSDVYTAATNLQVGQEVTLTGFLYWYNAPQLHVTSIGA